MELKPGTTVRINEMVRRGRPETATVIERRYDDAYVYDGAARYVLDYDGKEEVFHEEWLTPIHDPFSARKLDEINWSDDQVIAFQDVFTAVNGSPYSGSGNESIIHAIKFLRANPAVAKKLLED